MYVNTASCAHGRAANTATLGGRRRRYSGDGRVVVGCSGLRRHHVDPFGKTVLCVGTPKDGFGECIVGHDSPLDDRDAGVVALGGNSLLVTWFTLDTRIFRDDLMKYSPAEFEVMDAAMRAFPEDAKKYVGSWTMRSDDGGARRLPHPQDARYRRRTGRS